MSDYFSGTIPGACHHLRRKRSKELKSFSTGCIYNLLGEVCGHGIESYAKVTASPPTVMLLICLGLDWAGALLTHGSLGLRHDDSFTRHLLVKQFVRLICLLEFPVVRKEPVDIDLAICDELGAVALTGE